MDDPKGEDYWRERAEQLQHALESRIVVEQAKGMLAERYSLTPDEAYELIVVVLTDLGDGRTEMHFQQLGRMSAEQYKAAGSGWSMFFDRMAEHLTGG